ncbi:MAG: hypothetical protein F4151_00690, partial [Gammaproteobacteria bacterium]|nr:hypothetical protein [Gammaproteobacteria bacterium]
MLEAEGTSRKLISTRHGHLHVRSNGEGEPPLVLLHMGLSSGRMYRIRRLAVVTVPVFSPEEIPQYKDNYLHEPRPEADGTHLDWYWRWWRDGGFGGAAERSRAWSPDLLHEFMMDHLGAQPDPWMTYHAVFDHPTGEFVSKIRQPFLVVDVHDDLTAQTARA